MKVMKALKVAAAMTVMKAMKIMKEKEVAAALKVMKVMKKP